MFRFRQGRLVRAGVHGHGDGAGHRSHCQCGRRPVERYLGRQRQVGDARVHLVGDRARRTELRGSNQACKARVDAQNAKGGVNGRKIDLQTADDKTLFSHLPAAQDLIQNRHVFAVIDNSSTAVTAYRYIPELGCADDRRRVRRHLLQPEGQREHHRRQRERYAAAQGPHRHQRRRGSEEARRHEDGVGGLRHLAVVERGGH